MGFELNQNMGGIDVNIDIQDRICIFKDESGVGKSFMFNIIYRYCLLNNISIAKFDYESNEINDIDLLIQSCINKSIIILDNSELYVDSHLWDIITSLDSTILISRKSSYGIDVKEDMRRYSVIFDGNSLVTKRR